MNIPVETKPALWGFAAGAAALALIGFNWGGWMTGGKAEAVATTRAETAVVAALSPVCVANFRRGPEVSSNLAALKKLDSWAQGEFIEKGGWATVVDTPPANQQSSVARACAEALAKS